MFFFKKKKEQAQIEEAIPSTSTQSPVKDKQIVDKEKEGYGDEDKNQDFVNTAGKVGKAQHNFFRDMEKVQASTQNRAVPRQELALHATVQSAWLSLNGTVYDVTNYIKYHPGGKLILQGCGKECSELFNVYHPWVNGDFILKKYKLGYLVG